MLAVDEPKRGTLQALRGMTLEIVPEAKQVISYRVPAFRVQGKIVAGFAAFKYHLSYLPFSGSVLQELGHELRGYTMTKSALHFPVDCPLPKSLVEKLIATPRSNRPSAPLARERCPPKALSAQRCPRSARPRGLRSRRARAKRAPGSVFVLEGEVGTADGSGQL